MFHKSLLAGASLALLASTIPLQAAITVSLGNDVPPAGDLLSSFATPATGSIAWYHSGAANRRNVAFSFQIEETGLLNEIGLFVSSSRGGAGMDFSLALRKSDTLPTSVSGGSLVGNFSGQIDVAQDSGILKFNLGDDFSVTSGEYYIVVLTWTGDANSDKHFSVQYGEDASNISSGSWDASNGGSWVHRPTRDYLFYASGTQAIPEPSTVALLALSAAAIGVYHRRNRNSQR